MAHSDKQLMQMATSALFTHDQDGRIVRVNGPNEMAMLHHASFWDGQGKATFGAFEMTYQLSRFDTWNRCAFKNLSLAILVNPQFISMLYATSWNQ